jgi:hypothetical protein
MIMSVASGDIKSMDHKKKNYSWSLVFLILLGLVFAAQDLLYAADPAIMLRGGAVIRGFTAKPAPTDPCEGVAVGDPCSNGVLYGGTGFAGLGSYKYMTTPGHCTDSATPTCDGTEDDLQKKWANNSGTTAYNVNTGATSVTDGASNTTIAATNYTDTDAAKYCQNMTYPAGGYTDWYLPARDELNLVLYGMKALGKGDFTTLHYWSSTEYNPSNIWTQFFPSGGQADGDKTNLNHFIRCVRKY